MSDYKDNNLVVQSNKFVRNSYNNLKAVEIKIFDLFVSCIDTSKPKDTIEITKKEFFKALNVEPNYTRFKEITDELMSEIWHYTDETKIGTYHFVESVIWMKDDDKIKCRFSKDILPMLVELKTNFLCYSYADLNCLTSRYSMLLYKYVLSYIRQYKTLEFYVEMEELRKVLNLQNKILEFRDFNKKVLLKFKNDVNNSKTLPYLVDYEKITSGRKVKAIVFKVRPRTTNEEIYFADIKNPLIYEEMHNNLLKQGKNIEDIRNRQADMIINERKGENK